jgi:hypothetical protein
MTAALFSRLCRKEATSRERLALPQNEKHQGKRAQADKHYSGSDNDIHCGLGVTMRGRQEGRRSPPSGRSDAQDDEGRRLGERCEWERMP